MADGTPSPRVASSLSVGFTGVPGQRTFYVELEDAGELFAYVLEKGQVAAFSEYARRLLGAIGFAGSGLAVEPPPIVEPDEVRFRIGSMQLDYDEDRGLVALTLVPGDEDELPIVHHVTVAQLDAAAAAGAESVKQGRPRCAECGLAMDPDGHVCPTTNGDLRHHRA